nr:response regulator [Calditrichia bacterium]
MKFKIKILAAFGLLGGLAVLSFAGLYFLNGTSNIMLSTLNGKLLPTQQSLFQLEKCEKEIMAETMSLMSVAMNSGFRWRDISLPERLFLELRKDAESPLPLREPGNLDVREMAACLRNLEETFRRQEIALAEYQALLGENPPHLLELRTRIGDLSEAVYRMIPYIVRGRDGLANLQDREDLIFLDRKLSESLAVAKEAAQKEIAAGVADAEAWNDYELNIFYFMIGSWLITLALVAFLFFRKIGAPVTEMVKVSDALNHGDLRTRIKLPMGSDFGEIGTAINNLAEQIRSQEKGNSSLMDERNRALIAISRQMNTGISQLRNLGEEVLKTATDRTQRDFMKAVVAESEMLDSVQRALNALASGRSAPVQAVRQPFNLVHFTEELMKKAALTLQSNQIDLIYEIDPEVPGNVVGDPQRLKSALFQLLSEASQATGKGEIEISLSWEGIQSDNKAIVIFNLRCQVAESAGQNPAGNPPARQSSQNSLLAARQLQEMGGKLLEQQVRENEKHFQVRVPLEVHLAEAAGVSSGEFHNLHLALVEDNPRLRQVLSDYGKSAGMAFTCYASAAEALEKIVDFSSVDGIFIDASLPDMDGVTLARRLKLVKGGREVRMVLMVPPLERGSVKG